MKWTKREIKAMQGALNTYFLVNRPLTSAMGGGSDVSFPTRFREAVAAHRTDIVIHYIKASRAISAERAAKDDETVDHAKTSDVWGKGTEVIVDRFTKLAIEERKACAWLDKLIAKIRAEGLPPEVLGWDAIDQKVLPT